MCIVFSQDEFLDFFNLRLKDKYREFLKKEAWRNSPHQQGSGSQSEAEYDSGGGDDAGGGTATGTTSGGEGSVTGRPASKEALEVKVNGGMVRNFKFRWRKNAVKFTAWYYHY